jgi:hypothetical protein
MTANSVEPEDGCYSEQGALHYAPYPEGDPGLIRRAALRASVAQPKPDAIGPETGPWTEFPHNDTPVEVSDATAKVQSHQDTSSQTETDYELLPDDPHPYKPPAGIELSPPKKKIVEAGRTTDIFVTNNLTLLFERTVCCDDKPKLLVAEGGGESDKLSMERAFSPNRPDFVPTLAACCTALLLGRYLELSRRKAEFTGLFRSLVDQKIEKLRQQCPELPSVLSHAAYVMCYARYLEHGGKAGVLFNPYLNYVRALNRPDMRVIAFQCSNEIETEYKGQGRILATFSGLLNYRFFVPISDSPNTFKIPELVKDWFTRNVPLG